MCLPRAHHQSSLVFIKILQVSVNRSSRIASTLCASVEMPSINGDFIDLDLPVSQTTSASHRDDSTSASQPAPSITSSIISPPAPRDAAEDAWKTDDKNGLDTRADFLDSDSEEIKNGMLKDIASPTGLPTRRGYKDDCKLIWDLFNIVSAPRSQMALRFLICDRDYLKLRKLDNMKLSKLVEEVHVRESAKMAALMEEMGNGWTVLCKKEVL
ncbi:MAG: hypothetical protein L6R40_002584 [Gallowayella cf. fulva]|nr:MAG: hypothetical protein L6R40_002584 [Xanthomendoza cf. fulva]